MAKLKAQPYYYKAIYPFQHSADKIKQSSNANLKLSRLVQNGSSDSYFSAASSNMSIKKREKFLFVNYGYRLQCK